MYTIRFAKKEEARRLLEIYRPYVENTAITFEWDVPTLEEFEHRIETIQKHYPYLVLEKKGKIMGYAYVGPFKERQAYAWSVETSIYLDRNSRHKGYGSRLYEALEEECRKAGFINFYACIAIPSCKDDPYLNLDSVRFHEARGFKECGRFDNCAFKFDRSYGIVWMEHRIQDYTLPPKPVKTIG